MKELIIAVFSFFIVSSVYASDEPIQILKFKSSSLPLYNRNSGEFVKTIKTEKIALPLNIKEDQGSGKYLVVINGEEFSIPKSRVKTNKKPPALPEQGKPDCPKGTTPDRSSNGGCE